MTPSIWQLLILVAVIVLLFGTKKLRTLGSDLGASIKGFKKAMSDDDDNDKKATISTENVENKSADSQKTEDKE